MIIELGHFALILAFGIALLQMVVPLVGAHKGWRGWMQFAEPAATSQFILVGFAFLALTWAFVTSDFSVQLVYLNSNSLKPMIYKISGVWGNHEGSLLLWVLILTLYGACAAWFGGNLPETLRARVLAVQAAVLVAFYMFILFTSNPFLRLDVAPFDGRDLNPLLQDPGLAFHPPFLYLGYVGLSMAYSFAVAALIEGRVDAAWGRWVRPWTLTAWMFLTVGIALGSWWAYYELGWGGFWFWDPVENASFMPWLIAAALLHCSIVVEKREALKSWTILLSILAFAFSLLGTFIVRSGVITSVHAFANDPTRGVYLLIILTVFVGGALTLYAARAPSMQAKGVFSIVSRESGIVLNNILLTVAALVVFVGTIWPLVAQMAFGRTLSVGPPFFNAAFTPFMMVVAVVMPIGGMVAWKRGSLRKAMALLWPALILAASIAALAYAIQTNRSALGPLGIFVGLWVVFGSAIDVWTRTGRGPIKGRLGRLTRLPRADWGKAVSHAGMGVTILGISMLLAWQQEDIRVAQVGDRWAVGTYEIELRSVENIPGANYASEIAEMAVYRNGTIEALVHPEKRFYVVAQMPTTEAAINNGFTRDVYLVIGDPQANGGYAIRTYIKPFANWIWGGAILMSLGGLLSLSDRRLRVAAGAARPNRDTVPAE
ncbi:MAG: heme lyase CcmF/NrfE family subunit [Rhodobacterales bacterium]|nr:heme lyase CcmF/NrfE family subunit [Rhodobacterales bacterium]